MADQTIEVLLAGLRAEMRALLTDARERRKADTRQAVEAVKAAADEQMWLIDKRIDALSNRHSLEPALWGAACGVLVCAAALIFGVWLGDRGLTVHWLLTFGWHL